jgi:hypothetical protein
VALSNLFEFDGQVVAEAISATFARRGTTLPADNPTAFSAEFTGDATKNVQWTAFVKKAGITGAADLKTTMALVELFVGPPLRAASAEQPFAARWSPPGRWM